MTFTFIIMDSLYIMRNLLILFCLMVVFWTNLGNCAGSCDNNTQCHYNETRMHSTVRCIFEKAGDTAHPCHGSKVTCFCYSENYQLSSTDNLYMCRPDKWEDGLYDLQCLRRELTTEISTTPIDTTTIPIDSCDKYTQCFLDEARVNSNVSCAVEIDGNTAPPCYGHGSNITCSCNSENYQLSSPDNSYLCRPDKWEDGLYDLHCLRRELTTEIPTTSIDTTTTPIGELTTEIPTTSIDTTTAPIGSLPKPSLYFARGDMYANGTEIMYDCPEGWDFIGYMTAVCLHGVWTYEDANFTASPCDKPAPPDDLVIHNPDFAEGEMYANGTEIMYDCPDGWDLNGHMTAVCLYGVWTYEDAYCTGSCDRYTQCHYNETRVHSTVSCNIETAGNTAHPCYGHNTDITCSCKSENHQLSSPKNSYLCEPVKWEDGLYDLNCSTGFCDKYTQCHYDETWMHSTVSCNIETAGNTSPPCYGDRSNITCSCKSENYQLSSPDNSYLCRPDKWEDGLYDLYCLPSPCDEPAPPDDKVFHYPDFAQGEMYPNGIEIMYDCPEGWDFNGHMTAVCLHGVWTYEDAYCTASPCDEPAPPDDKVFHSPDFAEGEMYPNETEIMYDCPEGWDLNGHMTAVCRYGVWTYEDAFCTDSCDKYTQCHYDETCMHSTVICNSKPAGNTSPPCYGDGSNITCSCRSENHQLSSPKNSYLCRPDKWEDGLYDLYCLPLPCDEPAPPDDKVSHFPEFAQGEMYPNGTEIMYYCPDGLDLNGNRTAVCLYGVWTYEDAYCTAIPCDEPAPPDYKVFHFPEFAQGEMYPNGTEITYYCPDGFDLNGNRIAVCFYGVWTYEDAYCTDSPCKDPAPANVDVNVTHQNGEDEGKSGSRVSYSCPNGFTLHGSRSALCLCGRWIVRTVPSCSAVCSKSTDCKSEQISACDIRTRSCACPPGKTFQNGKCLVERIIKSSLQLEVAYKEDFPNTSSCTFVLLEHKICRAFEETFTRWYGNNWFVSCKVEAIRKFNVTTILADVVTRYDEDVAVVTPGDFDTHILLTYQALSGLRLISIMSKEGSYNACKERTNICDHENGYCIYHNGTNYECRCKHFTIDRNQGNPALHGTECDSCDKYTQCFLDEARVNSTVSCDVERDGNTEPPCDGHGWKLTCSCKGVIYRLFGINKSFLCRTHKWEDGLYDFHCEIDWWLIIRVIIIAICTLLFAVLLIWLVKKHYLRRGTMLIPSVEGVANEQVPPTANDESKFVSKATFKMSHPNAYQNDVNKEENDVTDHVGDNSPGDSPNNDPEEETV